MKLCSVLPAMQAQGQAVAENDFFLVHRVNVFWTWAKGLQQFFVRHGRVAPGSATAHSRLPISNLRRAEDV
jgi:uncharacterized cupin superfamily protein